MDDKKLYLMFFIRVILEILIRNVWCVVFSLKDIIPGIIMCIGIPGRVE